MNIEKIIKNVKLFIQTLIGQTPEQQWKKQLKSLLIGVPKNKIPFYTEVLKNQHHVCSLAPSIGGTDAISHDNVLTITKTILDKLQLDNFIGVTVMNGPVNLIHSMRYTTDEESQKKDIILLSVINQTVQAGYHKLQASYTKETMHDMNIMHDIDVEKEIFAALSNEIILEITTQMLGHISKMCKEDDIPPIKMSFNTPNELMNLNIKLNLAANQIAKASKRGIGNWMIVPSEMVDALISLDGAFVPTTEEVSKSNIMFEGVFNNMIRVYSSDIIDPSEILIGYKGPLELDSGIMYCPYIMLVPTLTDNTVTIATRHGLMDDDASPNYYRKIKLVA